MNSKKEPVDHICVHPGGSNSSILTKNDQKYWCLDNNNHILAIK